MEEDSQKEKQSKLIGLKLSKIFWNANQMFLFLKNKILELIGLLKQGAQ